MIFTIGNIGPSAALRQLDTLDLRDKSIQVRGDSADGTTLNIAGSPGVDQAGYAGLSGRVDEHWGRLVGTALLSSLFVAGAELVHDDKGSGTGNGTERKSPGDIASEQAAKAILDMAAKLTQKVSDIQPTIRIRPGKRPPFLT